MIRSKLAEVFDSAAKAAFPGIDLPQVEISEPRDPSHGDYACNLAMVAAKTVGMPPREVADAIVKAIAQNELIASCEIAGPGFINIRLEPKKVGVFVQKVLELGPAGLASASALKPEPSRTNPSKSEPKRINVEFVSVNPNGPITVGSGRGAAFGSALCNVLEAAGHSVHREYYVNDGVNSEQMRQFVDSVRWETIWKLERAKSEVFDLPYKGDYVKDVAKSFLEMTREFGQPKYLIRLVETECENQGVDSERILRALTDVRSAINLRFAKHEDIEQDNKFENQIGERPTEWLLEELELFGYAAAPEDFPKWDSARAESWLMAVAVLLLTSDTQDLWEQRSDFQEDESAPVRGARARARLLVSMRASRIHNESRQAPPAPRSFEYLDDDRIGREASRMIFAFLTIEEEWLREDAVLARALRKYGDRGFFQELIQRGMIHSQNLDLSAFGVTFDTWFSEQSLHDSSNVQKCLDELLAKGAADDEPIRRKLKLAKGGAIEDVEIEEQTGLVDEDGHGEGTSLSPPAPLSLKGEGEDGADTSQPIDVSLNQSAPTRSNPSESKQATLWLRSTKFGDDMDRVLRRKDGRLTYIASDVAYHKDKFSRGSKPVNGRVEPADKLITVLGPDHHGYIGRLHAVVAALLEGATPVQTEPTAEPLSDIEAKIYRSPEERDACLAALAESKEKLEVVIFQIVRFVKDGKPAPMRKRDGNIYTLRDLMAEIGRTASPKEAEDEQLRIGRDVARFFYLMRSHDTHMDFDIDLATKQSDENPVFYCQYAHARICSVLKRAEEVGLAPESGGAELTLLTHPKETALVKKICDLPDEVQRCAEDYGVHRLTTYAIELARTFHHFYDACRVVNLEEPELSRVRMALCQATKVALKSVFDLIGISAPEVMMRSDMEPPS